MSAVAAPVAGPPRGYFAAEPAAPGPLPEPERVLFRREEWRGWVAIFLLALLGAVILSLVGAAIADALTPDEVSGLFEPLVTPLFTLAGSVVGFYFGKAGP